jgi:hypothetical protein
MFVHGALVINSWHRRVGALVLLSTIGLTSSPFAVQSAQQPSTTGQGTSGAASSASHFLHITVNPSTANIIEGAVYGLDAEIENISSIPITIDIGQIQLAVQPELAPPNVSCTWFYNAVSNSKVPSPILMRPGDHFTVFFDTGAAAEVTALKESPQCKATFWGGLRRRLDFVPGNFAFVLTGTFTFTLIPQLVNSVSGPASTDPSASTKLEQHYFTETANLPVTIDQFQIITYAGLGGLLAFLVMSFRNANTLSEYAGKVQAASSMQAISRKPSLKSVIILRGAAAAILLSVTVTVIASRLSTTAFPVKVSVDDFWGALTVGFVSYFVGGKFIDKLSETLTPTPQPGGAPAPAAPPDHAAGEILPPEDGRPEVPDN